MFKGITSKLSIALLFVVTSVLLISGYLDYQRTEKRLTDGLEFDIGVVQSRLQTSLPAPLWNFEMDFVHKILLSEINSKFIVGIVVKDDTGEPQTGVLTESGRNLIKNEEPKGFSFVRDSALTLLEDGENTNVGSFKLYISDKHIQEVLNRSLQNIITQVIVVDVMILLLFMFSLRPIVNPLKFLTTAAHTIANGDFSTEIKRTSNDEVGDLAESFNEMRLIIKRKMQDLSKLNDVSEELAATSLRDAALKTALTAMKSHVNVELSSVYLCNDDKQEFELSAYYPHSEVISYTAPFSEGIMGTVLNNKKIVFIADSSQDAEHDQHKDQEPKALIAIPLLDEDKLIGVMNLSGQVGSIKFEESDYEFAESIARFLVITIKNIQMREEIEEHNRTLELKVQERTQALQEKNNDISNMMQNMHQGLFTILEDLSIHHEYSRHLETILGTDKISGLPFMDLLFANSDVGQDQLDQVETATKCFFGEDKMIWEFNQHCLIEEFVVTQSNGKKQILEVDWDPIINEEIIEKIMVTVRDVTEIRALQLEAEAQKQELEIIGQILAVSVDKFTDFTHTSLAYISKNYDLICAANTYSAETIQVLFRNMHTIKGNARTYAFKFITDIVHQAESTYDKIRKGGEQHWNKELLLDELASCKQAIVRYKAIAEEKLDFHKGDSQIESKLDPETIKLIVDTFEQVGTSNCSDDLKRAFKESIILLKSCVKLSFDRSIQNVLDSVPKLAEAVEKPAPEISINGTSVYIQDNAKDLLNDVFMHTIRNSIDHGIEAESERKEKGKLGTGQITISTKIIEDRLQIRVSDDGRGLALGKIKEKAVTQGLINDQQTISNNEVAEFVFYSGLSTAESVTEISGRGVGMDAVRSFLRERGASISLDLRSEEMADFVPFETVIELPNDMFEEAEVSA